MSKTIFLCISVILTAVLITFLFSHFKFDLVDANYNKMIKTGNNEIIVEIADTEEKRNLGLSGRKKLPKNSGMLFIFEAPAKYSFWMKNMRFPLDIIWIDENKKIIAISKNISHNTYPTSFSPHDPVKYVLEVNAEWAERNEVVEGDIVEF